MSFERLLYTDCRPGQGRQGGGGFQVQARSAGIDSAQERAAVGALLYEPQEQWIVAGRDVADFPLGLAHSATEGYGTAQGRYLGKEANGSRPGNYLADVLLTRDTGAYGVLRPAQLWRAPHWRNEPWDSTDCPQLTGAAEPGPLTVDGLADWVRGDPRRPGLLARLVTVLEERDGRRVTIVGEDPDDVVRWIGAATLLLPMAAALDVSFKVFSANPARAPHRVVGVPRSLNPQVTVGGTGSAFVLDADALAADAVAASERATWWVQLLTSADAYDVVDAVELAGQLADELPETAAVRSTAWHLVAEDEPLPDPAPLLWVLDQAPPALVAAHGAAVAQRLLDAPLTGGQLRTVVDALGGLADPELQQRLLAAELDDVRRGEEPPPTRLAPIELSQQQRDDMESAVSSAILLGSDDDAAAVLRVAGRHGVEPAVGPLVARLEKLVSRWVDAPLLQLDPASSALRETLVSLLDAEVRRRFRPDHPEGIEPVLRRLGTHLAQDRPLLDDRFAIEVFAAQAAGLPAETVLEQVRTELSSPRAAADPGHVAALQDALVRWLAVDGPLALAIVHELGRTAPTAHLAAHAAQELHRRSAHPTAADLDTVHHLRRRFDLRNEGLDRLAEHDEWFQDRLSRLRTHGRLVVDLAHLVRPFGKVDPRVLAARADTLLAAALGHGTPALGASFLTLLPADAADRLLRQWGEELVVRPTRRAVAWGVCWSADETVPEEVRARIQEDVRTMLGGLDDAARQHWVDVVTPDLPPESARLWRDLHSPPAGVRQRLRGRFGRG